MNSGVVIPLKPNEARLFAVAPMIDWTDRHCRFFHRQLSQHAVLYTEMITTGAIIHGKNDFLAYNEDEHPLVLQLGGSNPNDLARCTRDAVDRGYDEVNLNVGCPSDRVQNGRFGACLMAEPELVGECLKAMQDAAGNVPVSIKTRLGIDEQDDYGFLQRLLDEVARAGIQHVTLHARKAWLKGLSPKENREIPPLDYEKVYQVKRDYPDFQVYLNGGLQQVDTAFEQLACVDGVMLGRAAYQTPWQLAQVDPLFYQQASQVMAPQDVLPEMTRYIETHIAKGGRFWHVARHMLGLFQGRPGARQWRRDLSENGPQAKDVSPLLYAADKVIGQIDQST